LGGPRRRRQIGEAIDRLLPDKRVHPGFEIKSKEIARGFCAVGSHQNQTSTGVNGRIVALQ
jgi:hypothetical protein